MPNECFYIYIILYYYLDCQKIVPALQPVVWLLCLLKVSSIELNCPNIQKQTR